MATGESELIKVHIVNIVKELTTLEPDGVNGQDNFRTESVAESVLKNPYPVPNNLPDKDIRFRTEHPDTVQDMVCKIASEYGLSEY